MSRLLIPALTLLLGISLNAQPPTWSTETTVANSSFQNLRPRITSNASGEAVVLWGSNATGTNYAAVGGVSGFSTPVSVIPAGLNTWVANWIGSEIDAHNDNVWLTMFGQVNGDWRVFAIGSSDGGYTWGDTVAASPVSASYAVT